MAREEEAEALVAALRTVCTAVLDDAVRSACREHNLGRLTDRQFEVLMLQMQALGYPKDPP